MSNSREHEIMRRQLWISVFTATASASNCVKQETVAKYADYALEKFDQKFKPLPDEIEAVPVNPQDYPYADLKHGGIFFTGDYPDRSGDNTFPADGKGDAA